MVSLIRHLNENKSMRIKGIEFGVRVGRPRISIQAAVNQFVDFGPGGGARRFDLAVGRIDEADGVEALCA